jgi:VWFA-related protein
MRTPAIILLAALTLAAQQEDMPRKSDIIVTTKNVLVPTTVVDKSGNFVNGLQVSDFALYDNDRQQRITSDVVFQPISLVVAIQANAQVDAMIPKIRKIGATLDTLVLGDSGEAAVIAFDHRVQVLQPFTSEQGKIEAAIKKISVYGSSQSRLNDAAMEAMNMLRNRPTNRRRILLLISETRDGSSAARARDVLTQAQFSNVLVYSIDISHFVSSMTRTPPVPRPDPIPPEAHHVPAGGLSTLTTQAQTQTGNWIPALVEVFKGVKGVFVDNPVELYTKYTGGREYTFTTQASLDHAVSAIGDEIHSQYLLSYVPSSEEGGFHTIRVDVIGRPGLKTRSRPGYWIAGAKEGSEK